MKTKSNRSFWLETMIHIADPPLQALSREKLKVSMPFEGASADRKNYSHLEAFGRLICGMAPWIENGPYDGDEEDLRKKYSALIRRGIEVATDPDSPDYMNFSDGKQPLVDAAFLAHAIVRAPQELFDRLSENVKQRLITALKKTRSIKPYYSNWLLFSAMIEVALFSCKEDWDRVRIDYALKQHERWYLGDGLYGDGPEFHMDYYNSFVIQPMLVDIIELINDQSFDWYEMKGKIDKRAKRFAVIQERSISPEGTFPIVGRSIAYRFGVFQHLSQMALQHKLDKSIHPAQVRSALTKVIQNMIKMPGIFDGNGWLQIGLCGHQPELGEYYITTGSLYLCATVFLPLGLPSTDVFWQGDETAWTAKKAWSGSFVVMDHSLE